MTMATVDIPTTLTAGATFLVAVATLVKAFHNGAKTDAVRTEVKAVQEMAVPIPPPPSDVPPSPVMSPPPVPPVPTDPAV